jgi:hypothetical protein
MRRRLVAVGAAAAAALVALAIVLGAVPDRRALAFQVYAFTLCAIVLLWLLGRTGAARDERSAFDEARRTEPPDDEPVVDLARVEREVTLGVANAYDLHYRLRPRIRAIVTSRLADRRGIDLERQPPAAEAAVEPVVWELVRPDREPPRDRHGPGLGLPRLREVMEGLDRI